MNYIKEIIGFQEFVRNNQLSSGQISLWYALMSINNGCYWASWFTAANLSLMINTGLSRTGVDNARKSLKQYGLIDYKSNGTKATSYKMISISFEARKSEIKNSMENLANEEDNNANNSKNESTDKVKEKKILKKDRYDNIQVSKHDNGQIYLQDNIHREDIGQDCVQPTKQVCGTLINITKENNRYKHIDETNYLANDLLEDEQDIQDIDLQDIDLVNEKSYTTKTIQVYNLTNEKTETNQSKQEKIAIDKPIKEATEKSYNIFFDEIWAMYPRHINDRKNAIKPARRKELEKIGFDRLKKAIKLYLQTQNNDRFLYAGNRFFNEAIDNFIDKELIDLPKHNNQSNFEKPINKNKIVNYTGRKWDYDKLEEMEQEFLKK